MLCIAQCCYRKTSFRPSFCLSVRNVEHPRERRPNGPSRSSKVVDFGTNRKRVCDFLLVINSNLGHILPRFRDIAGFLLRTTHPYSIRILVAFPLNYHADVVNTSSEDPKLITRVITFEL